MERNVNVNDENSNKSAKILTSTHARAIRYVHRFGAKRVITED